MLTKEQSKANKKCHLKQYYERKNMGLCTRCGGHLDVPNRRECSICLKAHRECYQRRCERVKDYSRKKGAANRTKWWKQVLDHYGHECACCHEKEPIFLTIDHINNDGAAHRKPSGGRMKGDKLYRWLILNDFPPGFQILCFNCNCGKARNGGECPHKTQKVVI